jgi:alpha-1,2-mannosyltransferase
MSTAAVKSRDTARQRWFVAALLILFAAISVQYSHKALTNRSAIVRWLEQLKQWDRGDDIFRDFNYPNPPIMALILSPLAHLPPVAAALTLFYLKVAMTFAVFAWVFRLIQTPACPFPPWAKALTVLLSLRMIAGDLNHGNVNLFILFLVVGALYAFHWRQDGISGLLLALAICCKVTPALFVPYLVWKRAWRTLVACAAGMLLFLFFVPAIRSGWDTNIRELTSWVDGMILPYVRSGLVTSEHQNQSLPGVVFRLATDSPSFGSFDADNHYQALRYDNLVTLTPEQAHLLIKAFMGIFVLVVIWACRTPTTGQQGWRLAAEYSIVILGMLLFSERTWKHHCVTLVLPFAVVCYQLATGDNSRKMKAFLIGCLVAAGLLIASTSTLAARDDNSLTGAWDHFGKMAHVYGAFVWAYLVLLVALVVLLRRKPDGVEGAATG